MKYVILAAGKGSRLASQSEFKPLTPVAGKPLISHVADAVNRLNIKEIIIVLGYQAEALKARLQNLFAQHPVPVTYVYNALWEKENGFSLFAARDCLTEPFLLTMADHIVDPAILQELAKIDVQSGQAILAVDTMITNNPWVDMADVTKVYALDHQIRRIGKTIPEYNAFDTGVFYCSEQIFHTMATLISAADSCSLSATMQHLADLGRAKVMPIHGKFWIDVDDAAMLAKTELALQTRLPW